MAQFGQHDHFAPSVKSSYHGADRRHSEAFSPSHIPVSARHTTITNVGFDTSAQDANHILTNNDSQLMNTFFDDPNGFSLNIDMSAADANTNFAPVFGYPPPANAAETHQSTQNTQINQRTRNRSHAGAQSEGDDMSAASQLVNMAHASPLRPDVTGHSSWIQPASGSNDAVLRRSSDSYYAPSMQAYNAFASQQLVQAGNNVRTALSAGLVEPRRPPFEQHNAAPPSEAMPTHRYTQNVEELSFFSNVPQAFAISERAARPLMPFSFGSDSNFSLSGYRGPMLDTEGQYMSRRLLPLLKTNRIETAVDDEYDETEPQPPRKLHDRAHLNHLSFPIPHSANSSPGDLSALPFASPASSAPRSMSQFPNPLKRRNTDIEYSHTSAFGEQHDNEPTHKRHHSIIQHMTADQFMAGNNLLSAAQTSLVDNVKVESDNSTFGRPTGKTRPNVRASATPSSPTSDAASPHTSQNVSNKKKSRDSKARPNLTETQKRENHIISEQKRRNVIKQAFNDLNGLIPTLQGGKSGLSKAEVLKEVVNYLSSLVEGNAHMEALLNGTDPN